MLYIRLVILLGLESIILHTSHSICRGVSRRPHRELGELRKCLDDTCLGYSFAQEVDRAECGNHEAMGEITLLYQCHGRRLGSSSSLIVVEGGEMYVAR